MVMQITSGACKRSPSGVRAGQLAPSRVKQSAGLCATRSRPATSTVPPSPAHCSARRTTQKLSSPYKCPTRRAVQASAAGAAQSQEGSTKSNALWVAIAYIATLAINYGSNAGVFFGNTNADIARYHPTPLTPADWAFGIWGIIFLSQAAALWNLARGKKSKEVRANALNSVGKWWMLGWAAQSVWQLLFCYNTGITLAIAAAVLVVASFCFHSATGSAQDYMVESGAIGRVSRILLSMSTAINAAWLNVAAAVNACVAVSVNTHLEVLPIAATLAALVLLQGMRTALSRRSLTYALTLAWSFAGVYLAQASKYSAIQKVAGAGVGAMLAVSAVLLFKPRPASSGAAPPAAA